MNQRNLKRSSIIGTVLALLLGAGVAFAAWTSTGTGTGTATADAAQDLVVSATSPNELFPTGTVEVSVSVTNPNPYNVQLSSIDFDGAATDVIGCDAAVVTSLGASDLTTVVDADGGVVQVPVDVSMSNAATDECQNADFTVTFTANGSSTS